MQENLRLKTRQLHDFEGCFVPWCVALGRLLDADIVSTPGTNEVQNSMATASQGRLDNTEDGDNNQNHNNPQTSPKVHKTRSKQSNAQSLNPRS